MIPGLTAFAPPFLHGLFGSEQGLWELCTTASLSVGVQCRIARGRKMLVRQALFDEIAGALQFPWYFSDNWDSFEECLGDLQWFSCKHVILAISTAADLLRDEPDRVRQVFSDIMRQAVTAHARRAERSLHIVFQFDDPAEASSLASWFGPLSL